MLVALLCVFSPAASGAEGGKSAAQQLETMRRRMETGLALFVGGKAADAAAEFDAGFSEHPYSAFLFNAGVCYQKLGQNDKALDRYREYLKIDPAAPDADTVQKRIASLEAAVVPAPPPLPTPDGSPAPPSTPPALLPLAASAASAASAAPAEEIASTEQAMRSLVVIETEPAGAPLEVYSGENDATPAFVKGAANAGWTRVSAATAPASLSLAVGRYHVVIDKFRDFNFSETDIKVNAGHVYNFKANLSQGVFMSFLRVSANVKGAHVWLDDAKKERPEWGTTPYGELVPSGDHGVTVEVPGFQPLRTEVLLDHGEQKELEVRLARVDYGILRIDSDSPLAKVQIDNQPHGVWKSGEPPLDVQVASGQHHVKVEDSGRKAYDGMIDVPKGQLVPVHAKLIPKYPRGGAWTQAAIGAVFVGAGVFFGVESNKLYNQVSADRQAGLLDDSDSRITRGRIYAIGADCGFAAGGVLAALATYSFLRDPMPESTAKLDRPQEFDDPRKQRPTSSLPREEREERQEREEREERMMVGPARPPSRPSFTAGPGTPGGGAGFTVGGTF